MLAKGAKAVEKNIAAWLTTHQFTVYLQMSKTFPSCFSSMNYP